MFPAVAHIGRLIFIREVFAVVDRGLRPDTVSVAIATAVPAKARGIVESGAVVGATKRDALVAATTPAPIMTAGSEGQSGKNRKENQGVSGFHGADDVSAGGLFYGELAKAKKKAIL